MARPDATCWTLIREAAAGKTGERESFARRYAPIVRSYLGARWRSSPAIGDLDDAVQEVFLECFRQGGALERVDPDWPGGFRAFLYGVARNIAMRVESRRRLRAREGAGGRVEVEEIAGDETSLSRVFDRSWANALLREARALQEEKARALGDAALKRVELLRLRFGDDLPIREIARRWGVEAAVIHKEYARARKEFRSALLEVVAFHHPGSRAELENRVSELLALAD
jgi:RNA polymerase sigma-70 factor (ECF subfamily)